MALYFDDYEASSTYPDITQWLAQGADPNQFQTPQLSADLRTLCAGQAITLPHNGEIAQPAHVIVLEEPFGRERAEVADLIDFVICIDLPLEIALARKLLRMLGFFWPNKHPMHSQSIYSSFCLGISNPAVSYTTWCSRVCCNTAI